MNEIENIPLGRIARILNNFRNRNIYGRSSYGSFYLTNECNYSCDMCYMDSRPGLKGTRLDPKLSLGIMREFQGIDAILILGGEVTVLPYFEEQVRAASHAAKIVTVFTNGTGLLKSSIKGTITPIDAIDELAAAVKQRMEKNLVRLPSNVEVILPVTEYHLIRDVTHKAHRFHEAIIHAGALLAKEWLGRTDRPKVRFIVNNTPGKPFSGAALISRFGIEALGATGIDYPGETLRVGRGKSIKDARPSSEGIPSFAGGVVINHEGVFANDSSLVQMLHTRNKSIGQIYSFEEGATVDAVVQSIEQHVLKES